MHNFSELISHSHSKNLNCVNTSGSIRIFSRFLEEFAVKLITMILILIFFFYDIFNLTGGRVEVKLRGCNFHYKMLTFPKADSPRCVGCCTISSDQRKSGGGPTDDSIRFGQHPVIYRSKGRNSVDNWRWLIISHLG